MATKAIDDKKADAIVIKKAQKGLSYGSYTNSNVWLERTLFGVVTVVAHFRYISEVLVINSYGVIFVVE